MLLGIETAAGLVGVAVADVGGPLAGTWLRGDRRHAETLSPAIAHTLEAAGATLGDVEAIALDVGPGLFTGLRVGVATAQGLAEGLGIGILEVTSVDVLAQETYDAGWEGSVASVVDARRGEVFAQRYRRPPVAAGDRSDRQGVRGEDEPFRCTPGALAEELGRDSATLLVGTGAHRYADLFAAAGLRVAAVREPSPRVLVSIAAGRLAAGAAPLPPTRVRPRYLRDADAQINWVQR